MRYQLPGFISNQSPRRHLLARLGGASLLAVCCAQLGGCGASPAKNPVSLCSSPGEPTPGPVDTHCVGVSAQVVDANTCSQMAPAGDGSSDFGSSADADSVYGPVNYGTEATDDDCKYHVVWHVDPVCEDTDVFFYVAPTYLADGSAVTGAQPRLEVFLNPTTPAQNTMQTFTETVPGSYKVGPVRFDQPGQWTIRWHFFEYCSDFAARSPHGHAAFFVTVP